MRGHRVKAARARDVGRTSRSIRDAGIGDPATDSVGQTSSVHNSTRDTEIGDTATNLVRQARGMNYFASDSMSETFVTAFLRAAVCTDWRIARVILAHELAARIARFQVVKRSHAARAQRYHQQPVSCREPDAAMRTSCDQEKHPAMINGGRNAHSDTASSIVMQTGNSYAIVTTCVITKVVSQPMISRIALIRPS